MPNSPSQNPAGRIKANPNDLILGAGGLALAFFVWWMLGSLPAYEGFRVGAGYMPRLVVGLTVLTSLLLIARGFLRAGEGVSAVALRPLGLICLSLGLFALLIEQVGLVLTSFVTVFVGTSAAYNFRPGSALAVSAATTAVLVVLFAGLLSLPVKVWP